VDTVETSGVFDDRVLKQAGIMGSAIIGGQTTLMVDVHGLVSALNPDWFSVQEAVQTAEGKAATILYAEDSRFFRNQVKGVMEETGYKVIAAEDGMAAWELLQKHAGEVALVVTDIEMPQLDGYGLARKIKSDKRFSPLPVIALTTLAGEDDVSKGKAAGIDDYQVKLDRESLVEAINRYLEKPV
jgi:two-component system chemotaxis sensor kinase CheA